MWQRIQTLYLAIATALLASMFFCKFATIVGPQGNDLEIMYWEKIPYVTLLAISTIGNIFSREFDTCKIQFLMQKVL